MKIAIIQANISWLEISTNLEYFDTQIDKLDKDVRLVVLPEMFSTGFNVYNMSNIETMEGESVNWLKRKSHQSGKIICGSLSIIDNGKYFNRFVWMQPNGVHYKYDKRHLFSYGKENLTYTAGDTRLIVQVNGVRFCLMVCYDLRFPVWARQQKESLYDVLIYVANWPDARMLAWNTLLQARAIENQCYVIGCNRVGVDGNDLVYSGHSQWIDPLGAVKAKIVNDSKALIADISIDYLKEIRIKFPFLDDADNFGIIN
jgi:omega-amidase